MAGLTNLTTKKRAKFLATLREGWSVSKACKGGGFSRDTAYRWRDEDEDFASAWDDAIEAGTDALEDVALGRAKKQSDTLMIFTLKARRPEKYRENVQHDHHVAGEIVHRFARMTPEDRVKHADQIIERAGRVLQVEAQADADD